MSDLARATTRGIVMNVAITEATISISTVSTLLVEANPFTTSFDGGGAVLRSEYSALPRRWIQTLDELLVHSDATHCWRCDEPVGFVLHGDERLPRWVSTGLAREGYGPIAVLCEDCAPHVPECPQKHSSREKRAHAAHSDSKDGEQ